MNRPTEGIEELLRQQQPTVPSQLRNEVESAIEKSIRRYRFRDDLKWVSICLSVLCLAVAFHLVLLRAASKQSVEFSGKTMVDSEAGHRMAKAWRASSEPITQTTSLHSSD